MTTHRRAIECGCRHSTLDQRRVRIDKIRSPVQRHPISTSSVTFRAITAMHFAVRLIFGGLLPDPSATRRRSRRCGGRARYRRTLRHRPGEALIAAKHDVRKNDPSGLTLMHQQHSDSATDHLRCAQTLSSPASRRLNADFAPFDPQNRCVNPSALREEGVTQLSSVC